MATFDKRQDLPVAEQQRSARTVLVKQRLSRIDNMVDRQCTEFASGVPGTDERDSPYFISLAIPTKACDPLCL